MYDVEDENRFWSKVETGDEDECWECVAMALDSDGYGQFWCNNKNNSSHRVSFQLKHNRLINEGMSIMHSCNNRSCVNPFHLSEGTNTENSKYMVETGQSLKGEKNKSSKLTEKQVLEIRHKHANTDKGCRKLGKEYGVDHTTIMRIINRKMWQHI
jgi:hypothetical protein